MGLRDITIKRTSVSFQGENINVRGISASDLMAAAQDYAPEMAAAFTEISSGSIQGDVKSAVLAVAGEFPDLVAATIALASDEYDPACIETARQLPFPTQLELVEAIFKQTFSSEADVKKLLESLTRIMVAASGALKEITDGDLLTGTGEFGVKLAS